MRFVGELRMQSAYEVSSTPVILVSKDPKVAEILTKLEIVRFYPDTTDDRGN